LGTKEYVGYQNGAYDVFYTYDDTTQSPYATGKLTKTVDGSGTTQFYYDILGRTSQVTRTIGGVQYGTGFQYDLLGHITSISYPDDDAVTYTYDGAFNLAGVWNSNQTASYAAFSGYNALKQPGTITFPNNIATSFAYDPQNNRLDTLTTTNTQTSAVLQGFTYHHDSNGNVTGIDDSAYPANPAAGQTFTYDGLNRLVSATSQAYNVPGNTINIGYDAVGNIDYNADSSNPANRNNVPSITYDYDNQITGITTGGSTVSFVYDSTGRRVQKMLNGASVATYVNRLYEIREGVVYKHIFAGGRRIACKIGSQIYYCHPDHLGSLNIATDMNGSVRQSVACRPFGEVVVNTGTIDLPYKFTGHELDPETGLYYCGARYLDPAQGRFITPDTFVQSPGDPQTLNRYAYARNNPLVYTDPSGHCIIQDIITTAAIGLGISEAAFTVGLGIVAGAALGATMSAITGGNPLIGALTGAIAGGLFAGAGNIVQTLPGVTGGGVFTTNQALIEASLIHAVAGAASGAIGAAITGGNVGISALTGGISAGVACGVGGAMAGTRWFSTLLPEERIFAGLVSQVGIGAVTGGVTSEIVCGQFLHGFGQGAWTAAFGFLFNEAMHEALEPPPEIETDNGALGPRVPHAADGCTEEPIYACDYCGGASACYVGPESLNSPCPGNIYLVGKIVHCPGGDQYIAYPPRELRFGE
jgi:RHS repeat-associated protein